ncbi:hypothetical protein Fmac_026136 [Flemingia macrophylla]|uniref:Putative plant transposon protein domain-containing protein n=1 Tax=Flemingia macrophylla TaxID=520843 RepID=A0ABD1LE14_9FABA
MAPKSLQSKKRKTIGESSTVVQEVFRSIEHATYSLKVSKRSILIERELKLEKDEFPEFVSELKIRKWKKIGKYVAPANIRVVHEFYTNAREIGPEISKNTSYVRGVTVHYDGDIINEFLGTKLQRRKKCQFTEWVEKNMSHCKVKKIICVPGGHYEHTKNGRISCIKKGYLLPIAKIWVAFIHSNISPCSHTFDVHESRSFLLYAIIDKLDVDVGNIIANKISRCANRTSGALIFPSLITHLCEVAGVNVCEPPFEKVRKPIDKAYINRYCHDGSGVEVSVETSNDGKRMSMQTMEDVKVALNKSEKRDRALRRGLTMIMDGIRMLATQTGGQFNESNVASTEMFAKELDWDDDESEDGQEDEQFDEDIDDDVAVSGSGSEQHDDADTHDEDDEENEQHEENEEDDDDEDEEDNEDNEDEEVD